MELDKVQYFHAVAQTGSISRASKKIGLSQPALSIQIQTLEERLGVKLFERHSRGILLTEEGKVLYERTSLLSDWISETSDLISGLKEISGRLTIGSYSTATSCLLPKVIKEFGDLYPEVTVCFDYSSTDEIIRKVKNLELDCAIISEVPDDNHLDKTIFYKDEMVLAASVKSRVPSKVSPKDLIKYRMLSYPLKQDYCYRKVDQKYGRYIEKSQISLESEFYITLKEALLEDIGIGFMPKYLLQDSIEKKQVKLINLSEKEIPIHFYFVTRKNRKLPNKVAAFREFVLNHFND